MGAHQADNFLAVTRDQTEAKIVSYFVNGALSHSAAKSALRAIGIRDPRGPPQSRLGGLIGVTKNEAPASDRRGLFRAHDGCGYPRNGHNTATQPLHFS